MQLLLINTILSTQTAIPTLSASSSRWSDSKSLEACFIRGTTGNADLARGLLFFVRKELGEKELKRIIGGGSGRDSEAVEQTKTARKNIKWAVERVKNVLEVGASVNLTV